MILLDEPLSNLDAKLREEARAWLRELIVEMQLSRRSCVTHDQGEALAMSDRILLLNNGVIEQQGTPQEMYGNPRTLFAADFMGSNNRLKGRVAQVRDGRAAGRPGFGCGRAIRGAAPAAKGTGMIRLERVRIAKGRARTTSSPSSPRRCTSATNGSTCSPRRQPLRAHGATELAKGKHRVELPREDLWVF